MPARRSEDPSLTDEQRAGESAVEHWDEERRAAARPAPFGRSLPDRDQDGSGVESPSDDCATEFGATCSDGDGRSEGSGEGLATEE
ncbi:hypothetical protein GCM10009592_25410 [Brachybacterium rhamnosum]